MYYEETKILKAVKIIILLLITLLGVSIFKESTMVILLLFYIAFVKE